MTCRDVDDQIEAIVSGEEASEAVRAHVEGCVRCAAALATARRIDLAIAARPVSRAPAEFTTAVVRPDPRRSLARGAAGRSAVQLDHRGRCLRPSRRGVRTVQLERRDRHAESRAGTRESDDVADARQGGAGAVDLSAGLGAAVHGPLRMVVG